MKKLFNHNCFAMFKIPKFIKHNVLYLVIRDSMFGKRVLIKNKKVIKVDEIADFQNQARPVLLQKNNTKNINVGIVKNGTFFSDYVSPTSSWLYYLRFCKNNNIKHEIYDIKKDDWLDKAKKFNIIFWHPNSTPEDMYIAENKIYILEKILNIKCFPSYHEIWQYEDKNRAHSLYQALNLNYVNSFTSNSYTETLEFLSNTHYPLISKVHIGAGSSGVVKLENKKQALKVTEKVFGSFGKKTKFPYLRQKDYVFFQEFIEDATFDLRIIIVGNKLFGYYRYPNKGDFRASGSGNFEKKAIPKDALELAFSIKNKLQSRLMGVDLMYSKSRNKYFIIETSLFNQIDTPRQLVVDGISGYYDADNDFKFIKGEFWIAELTAELIINEYISN